MKDAQLLIEQLQPASWLLPSLPSTALQDPAVKGGRTRREMRTKRDVTYGEVLPYIWLKSDIWKAVKKQEKSGQAWAMDHDLSINHGPWTT